MTDETQTQRNSSLALERLRIIVDQLEREARDQLPTERELAEQIGVGRRAVRRALDVLEAEGRIWRRQGAGTFISAARSGTESRIRYLPEMSNMFEVMEVRLRIEPALARLAALRATPADIARMREISDKVARATDMDSRELWDSSLHRAVAMAPATPCSSPCSMWSTGSARTRSGAMYARRCARRARNVSTIPSMRNWWTRWSAATRSPPSGPCASTCSACRNA